MRQRYPNAHTDPDRSLCQGTVALLDLLGFKGIWKRFPPDDVLGTFDKVRKGLEKLAEESQVPSVRFWPLIDFSDERVRWRTNDEGQYLFSRVTNHRHKFRYSFISDTIALAYVDITDVDVNTVLFVARAVHWVQQTLLQSKIKALARGYICSGKLFIGGSTIMGPAIDEAATNYNLSHAACTWVAPSLLDGPYDSLSNRLHPILPGDDRRFWLDYGNMLPRIEVPMKGGGSVETLVVSPFYRKFSGYYRRLESALNVPEGRLDIAIKRNATLKVASQCEHRICELCENSDLDEVPKYSDSSSFERKLERMVRTGQALVVRELEMTQEGTKEVWLEGFTPTWGKKRKRD